MRKWKIIDLTEKNLENVYQKVCTDPVYGREMKLIEEILQDPRYQKNTDVHVVAMKIALIDVTNSTHLHQHKEKINLHDLAERIVKISDLDAMMKEGNPEAVNQIAVCGGDVNLFSFASKYCFCHSSIVYGKDSYAKFDTLVKGVLPLYLEKKGIRYHGKKVCSNTLETMRKNKNYAAFNGLITEALQDISVENKRAKFDYMMWYSNRKAEKDESQEAL